MLSDRGISRLQWLRRSPWPAGFLLFTAYVATAAGTLLFVQSHSDPSLRALSIAAPWLAAGVGVAGILLGGARLWPALFAGYWVVWGVIAHDPPIAVALDAAAEAGSIVIIVQLLSIWGFRRSFDHFRDPLILIAAAGVGQILAMTVDWLGEFAAAWLSPESLSPVYRAMMTDAAGAFPLATRELVLSSLGWSVNCIAGIILVVPLTSADPDKLRKTYLEHPLALFAFGFSLLAWITAALTVPLLALAPLLVTALMIVAWAAVRFGPPIAAFVTLAMSLVVASGAGLRLGPLASRGSLANVGLQWGFIALLALTGLWLTVLLAERSRALKRLSAVAERYQRLFKANPSPLWVADPQGGGRILMVNDEAIRHYGYSELEFLAMSVDRLDAQSAPAPAREPIKHASGGEARFLRHRTRDGKLIDVELLSTPIELDGRRVELCYAIDVTDRVELHSQLLAVAAIERDRLSQELHDGLGQVLTGLCLGAQSAAGRVARGAGVDGTFIDFLVDAGNQAGRLWRQLARGVSPLQDANGDLLEALRRLPESLPPDAGPRLEIVVNSRAPLNLSLQRSEHLYRVTQEAVTNALKHARATRIRVRVEVSAQAVQVSVEDDGVGIHAAASPSGGIGMRSMGLRASAIGATIELGARPGGGTVVRFECAQQEHPAPGPAPQPSAGGPSDELRPAVVEQNRPSERRSAPTMLGYLGRCLLFAVAYFASLVVSVLLAHVIDPRVGMSGARMAVPTLAAGVALAGLILGGRRLWPGIFFGALIGGIVLFHDPWQYAITYSAAGAIGALLMLELLSRWQFSRAFEHWQDPLVLIGAAAIGATVVVALYCIGMMGYQWMQPGKLDPVIIALMTDPAGASPTLTAAFLFALARWWADGVAGVVLFVPLFVATPPIWRTLRGHEIEAGFWSLILLGWVASLFLLHTAEARLPLVAVALMLLVWAVVRFGVASASIAISVCTMASTLSFALQRGVLTTTDLNEGVDSLWGFLSLLAGIGMFLMSLLAERNRTLQRLAATATRARRLFECDPHPLWVQERATGRIVMVNEEAIHHYGYSEAEWLAMSASSLDAVPGNTVNIPSSRDQRLVATRHRVKSGALIDVELSFAPIDIGGRSMLLCFAVDVTERNALQRGFLEATDSERRRLLDELQHGLGRALTELEFAASRLERKDGTGGATAASIEILAQASQRAAEICRQTAHRVSSVGRTRPKQSASVA